MENSQRKQIKKVGKDQESIQLSTTPDPGYQWESDNVTTRHHKREPRGQPPPPPRAGVPKAPTNRRAQKNNKTRQKQYT